MMFIPPPRVKKREDHSARYKNHSSPWWNASMKALETHMRVSHGYDNLAAYNFRELEEYHQRDHHDLWRESKVSTTIRSTSDV